MQLKMCVCVCVCVCVRMRMHEGRGEFCISCSITSNSSNVVRWWKYAWEKIRYTLRQTDPNFATEDSL